MQASQDIISFLGNLPEGITLVAVSKTRTPEEIMELYDSGHRIFGENRVQELTEKQKSLPDDIEWHMVGHLQSNKVKYIASFIHMIHSIDSLKLLRVVDKEARKNNRIINCLLQVHIATEETKFGFDADELKEMLQSDVLLELDHIRICGLMGMATFTGNMDQVRKEFAGLKALFEELKRGYVRDPDQFTEISMGMSGDYEIAMEEGSTIIRIGTLLFGPRSCRI